jgi:hypothetical protein
MAALFVRRHSPSDAILLLVSHIELLRRRVSELEKKGRQEPMQQCEQEKTNG